MTVAPAKPLPPGDFGLPYIGERPRLLDLEYMMQQYKRYGPVFKTRVLGRHIAVFMGPEGNRFLLQTGMQYFSWRKGWPFTFQQLIGESLFVQDGEEHRQKRRLIMPAFHRSALQTYLTTMEDITLRYLDKWAQQGELRWLTEQKQFTFEIASTLIMGSAPGTETVRLSQMFEALASGFITLPVRWPWTTYGKALAARRELVRYIDQAIVARRHTPTQDALSLMVETRDEEGNGLTNEELQSQTILMLFAGHDTSSSLLTSVCMALAQQPAVWDKARTEQDTLKITGRLTMEHFKQMPFLDQILKEAERMYPPVPAGFRGVIETFEFNGYTIPKGWMALYPINVAHRDPAVYSDPDRFDPERFGSERDEGRVPFSLVGFGGGPRVCLGYGYAQMEMKLMLSYLLRFYQWELQPGQNLNMAYRPTLQLKDGLRVRFWRR